MSVDDVAPDEDTSPWDYVCGCVLHHCPVGGDKRRPDRLAVLAGVMGEMAGADRCICGGARGHAGWIACAQAEADERRGPERSEAQSPKDCQTDSKERESASLRPLTEAEAVKAINRALSAMHGSEYVGGPTECEAWRIVLRELEPFRTDHKSAPEVVNTQEKE